MSLASKIILVLVFSAAAFGQPALLEDSELNQKKINTMGDFIELEKTLKSTQALDPVKSNYYLGLLYMSSHTLNDGKEIRPDYDKALGYLEKSLEQGNVLAAYSVAMLFLYDKKIDNAIFVLHVTLESFVAESKEEKASGAYLSAALASIVLDFKSDDREALSLAIMHLKNYVDSREMPSGDYLLSQLYLRSGELNLANMRLTKACKHILLPDELKETCKTFKAK